MEFMGVKIDWPLDRNIIRRSVENNTFGMVRRNSDGSLRPHQGWDFFAPAATPVYSISDGEVITAGNYGDFGNLLVVTIAETGLYAAYAHLSHIETRPGERVKRGELIGCTGNSGNAATMKGPDEHLHFEVREVPLPGKGLAQRISPLKVFGFCPLHSAVSRSKN